MIPFRPFVSIRNDTIYAIQQLGVVALRTEVIIAIFGRDIRAVQLSCIDETSTERLVSYRPYEMYCSLVKLRDGLTARYAS